jgi:hypothetical protein
VLAGLDAALQRGLVVAGRGSALCAWVMIGPPSRLASTKWMVQPATRAP